MRAEAQKIGYVNMQDIVTSMPEYAKADTAIAAFQRELGQQFQDMQQEFNTKAQAFIKDSATLSEVAKQAKRAELQDAQNRLYEFNQGSQDRIQQKQAEVLKPVVEKAQQAVHAVAKAKGYSYVISDNGTGDTGEILVVRPAGDDLTAAVKANLGLSASSSTSAK